MRRLVPLVVVLCVMPVRAEPPSPKEALQAVQDLIGSWKATGEPQIGTREEKLKGFWIETIAWEWKFKGDDAWLHADFTKGKFYTSADLRFLPKTATYQLALTSIEKKTDTFEGSLLKKQLILDRTDETTRDVHRLIFHMLHAERHLIRYEVQPAERTRFAPVWQVGATREGVAFANAPAKRECIVSGGTGTTPVMFKGATYYVCCGGCRDAFNDTPEKYIREFEAKQKKQP